MRSCHEPRRDALRSRFARWFAAITLLFTAAGGLRGQSSDPTGFRWHYYAGKNSIIYSSPAVGPDHTIYVGIRIDTNPRSGLVLAINPDGNSEKWSVTTPEEIEGSPTLSNDGTTVYIGCADGRMYALNTADGSPRWPPFDTGRASSIYSTPAVAPDGTVYVGSSNWWFPGDSVFYAVDPQTHDKKWAVSAAGSVESSPAIAPDGTVYFGAGNVVYAVDPVQGTVKWTYQTVGTVFASPAIGGDGTVYIGTDANEFFALNPDSTIKWKAPISVQSGAAIGADGTIYVGSSDGKLYALNRNDGSIIRTGGWPFATKGGIYSVPAVRADGTILFGSDDHHLYALNPDGSQKWVADLLDTVETSPVIDTDGKIYVGTSGGFVYSYNGSSSPVSAYSPWPMFNHGPAHRSRAPAPVNGGRLLNVSTRGIVGPGSNMIAGVVVQGTSLKQLLVRGVGPTLKSFGLANALTDPSLSVTVNPSVAPFINDNWQDGDGATITALSNAVGAFPLPPGSKDAALPVIAAPGLTYTAMLQSVSGDTGIGLAEIYDTDPDEPGARLINISTRGHVGNGDGGLIPGFVIGGPGRLRVLVRAVGPGLTSYGVSGVLSQPNIAVYTQDQQLVGSNTGWSSGGISGDLAGAANLVGAFALTPGSSDSAMILSLDPGAYTAVVRGADGATGEALVEVYVLPY